MSLAINSTTPEGIVLAADSRQSYRNRKGMARIGSDSAFKVFEINRRVGAAVTGMAFLPEDGVLKNISKFIDELKQKRGVENFSVFAVAQNLHKLFNEKYNWQEQLEELPNKIKADLTRQGVELLKVEKEKHFVKFEFKDKEGNKKTGAGGVDRIDLLVAGYNHDGSHEVYTVSIPGEIGKKRDSRKKGMEYGASWIGQIDVVSRIVLGWDGRIGNLDFVQKAQKKVGAEEITKQLRSLEYSIQWGVMSLQDAIDFCVLMIQTTSAIQRFSDGIAVDPGAIPGVGGPVDVAVIIPEKGFVWVTKKNLKVGENEIDLAKAPDLPPAKPRVSKTQKPKTN